MKRLLLLPVLLLPFSGSAAAPAQDGPTQEEVDKAIERGAKWLLKRFENGFNGHAWNSTVELVMLTLSHANVPPDNPVFQDGLKTMLECKLNYNYRVALHAMALARIDPGKHKKRIAHCAQWIIDTQHPKEGWGYPGPLSDLNDTPDPIDVPEPEVVIKETPGKGSSVAKIRLKRKRGVDVKLTGDISNSQFALLGLRACEEAGIEIPRTTWRAAEAFYTRIQRQDGGWGYYINEMKDKTTYASMTMAGVCSLAIALYYQDKKPLRDRRVRAGMRWLEGNWSLTSNPGVENSHVVDPQVWQYYYLYSVERTGRIMMTDKIAKKEWYPPGARWLLGKQKSDGSWNTGLTTKWTQAGDLEVADTCFAILFLAKATPPLIATGGGKKK